MLALFSPFTRPTSSALGRDSPAHRKGMIRPTLLWPQGNTSRVLRILAEGGPEPMLTGIILITAGN
jgi:hypothetical protein